MNHPRECICQVCNAKRNDTVSHAMGVVKVNNRVLAVGEGDKLQRYEVWCRHTDLGLVKLGWTNDKAGGSLLKLVMTHVNLSAPKIVDRHCPQGHGMLKPLSHRAYECETCKGVMTIGQNEKVHLVEEKNGAICVSQKRFTAPTPGPQIVVIDEPLNIQQLIRETKNRIRNG